MTARTVCTRCVMDTSDPEITFDAAGVCGHCHQYDAESARVVHSGAEGAQRVERLVKRMRAEGRGNSYDCVIGVSGGVDSSYVAWKLKQLGVRPLAVHLDNGWNSELAIGNIEQLVKRLGIDLHTHVLDWQEFRDLQLAFLKASTPDAEVPTDHAIFALLRRTAARLGTRWIVTGVNQRTESHLPREWSQGHLDWRYICSVHRQFGSVPLKTFPALPLVRLNWYRLRQRWVDILDNLDYSKADAIAVLERELGWRNYGGKHYESIYTRFFQGWILPRKFGYDKRRAHLSSLICSGQIGRDEALAELANEPYPAALQREDLTYVIKKLGLTPTGFDELMRRSPKRYADYPSYARFYANPLVRAARNWYRARSC